MEKSERLTYSFLGALVGCVATIVIGFSVGGWMTDGGSDRASIDAARAEMIKVLVPHCVDQALHDPNFSETLAQIKNATSYVRAKILIQAGWATLLPATDPDLVIATACMENLISDHRY